VLGTCYDRFWRDNNAMVHGAARVAAYLLESCCANDRTVRLVYTIAQ